MEGAEEMSEHKFFSLQLLLPLLQIGGTISARVPRANSVAIQKVRALLAHVDFVALRSCEVLRVFNVGLSVRPGWLRRNPSTKTNATDEYCLRNNNGHEHPHYED